jgi:hypothetical protein
MAYAARTKGLDPADPIYSRLLERQTRAVLTRLVGRGQAFRFETKPVTWSRPPVRAGGSGAEKCRLVESQIDREPIRARLDLRNNSPEEESRYSSLVKRSAAMVPGRLWFAQPTGSL